MLYFHCQVVVHLRCHRRPRSQSAMPRWQNPLRGRTRQWEHCSGCLIRLTRHPTVLARRVVGWGLLGFTLQYLTAILCAGLALLHAHFEIGLGWHAQPANWYEKVWLRGIGPVLFSMPDPGAGDNGDIGDCEGLLGPDRAQQVPTILSLGGQQFFRWRAVRGSLLGLPLGEQWATIGPISPTDQEVELQRVEEGEQPRAVAEAEVLRWARHGGDALWGEFDPAVYERYFGPLVTAPPCWAAAHQEMDEVSSADDHSMRLRTIAGWGWPVISLVEAAEYEWRGGLEGWDRLALVHPVPGEGSSGAPLWALGRSNWIAMPAFKDVSLVPGLPWHPLLCGSLANTAVFSLLALLGWRVVRLCFGWPRKLGRIVQTR